MPFSSVWYDVYNCTNSLDGSCFASILLAGKLLTNGFLRHEVLCWNSRSLEKSYSGTSVVTVGHQIQFHLIVPALPFLSFFEEIEWTSCLRNSPACMHYTFDAKWTCQLGTLQGLCGCTTKPNPYNWRCICMKPISNLACAFSSYLFCSVKKASIFLQLHPIYFHEFFTVFHDDSLVLMAVRSFASRFQQCWCITVGIYIMNGPGLFALVHCSFR